ncbi:MAG: PQQ-binding-like beta-propeller repeat protein, partial [Gammaproteobacteria bacterium]
VSSDPKSEFRHGLYGDVTPAKDLSKHVWKVYALDRSTGKIVWERTAYEGVPKAKRHPKSSQASSTPATDGKHVLAFFGSEGLYCYDLNGKLLWKQDLGVLSVGWFYDPDYEWGVGSSPIIYKNLVIVQCDIQKDSFIAAFDLRTGKPVWRTPRDEIPSWGTPTVYEGKTRAEIVTNAAKRIRGYDALTGRELWWLSPNSEVTVATPVAADGLIFVTAGYPPIRPIYAIRADASGNISLKENEESNPYVAWSNKRAGTYIPTPIVYGGYLYTLANNGILTCYKAKTGERVYQQRIGDRGGAYSASPVAVDEKLYFTSEDGEIFVVKAGPQYELLAVNPIGEVLMATPAIARGMLIVRSMRHVYGIGEPAALKSKGAK